MIFQIGMEQNSRLQFQGKINSLLMKAFIVHVILQMTSLHDTSVQDKHTGSLTIIGQLIMVHNIESDFHQIICPQY